MGGHLTTREQGYTSSYLLGSNSDSNSGAAHTNNGLRGKRYLKKYQSFENFPPIIFHWPPRTPHHRETSDIHPAIRSDRIIITTHKSWAQGERYPKNTKVSTPNIFHPLGRHPILFPLTTWIHKPQQTC